jgi:hypothetical protein
MHEIKNEFGEHRKEIRCIHPGQTITRLGLSGRALYVYNSEAYWKPDKDQYTTYPLIKTIIGKVPVYRDSDVL